MCKRFFIGVSVIVGLAAIATPGSARILENWPYDKLMKEADLVVFAVAVKTEDTTDEPPKHDWPCEFAGQNTTFTVTHTLKGKVNGKEIKVLHFKWGKPKKGKEDFIIIENGPLFVAFETKNTSDHLLFLKAMKDGRYEPVSGRIDPQLSVRLLSEPKQEVKGEK